MAKGTIDLHTTKGTLVITHDQCTLVITYDQGHNVDVCYLFRCPTKQQR